MTTLDLIRSGYSPETLRWLELVRHCKVEGFQKVAVGLDGAGGEVQFEQAMSNLAHAYLKDKAPGLLPYEVGFQLLDKNEDNTRAVGVFGFKVGQQWLYAPVFFLSGELKGHELLYLKDQDAFVPLKENWLNHILNKKPNVLGEGINRDSRRLGMTSPDLQAFSHPPSTGYGKSGSFSIKEGMDAGAAAFAHVALTGGHDKQAGISLSDFIKQDIRFVELLAKSLHKYAELAEAFQAIHGDPVAFIKDALSHIQKKASLGVLPPGRPRSRPRGGDVLGPATPLEKGAVTVITVEMVRSRSDDYSEEERETTLADGITVRDDRKDDEVSKAYAVPVQIREPMELSNPTETGIYDVLMKPGAFVRCLVVVDPLCPKSFKRFCTVVPIENKKAWLNAHPASIWVRQADKKIDTGGDGAGDGYSKFVEELPAFDSVPDEGTFMVLGPRGLASCPFSPSGKAMIVGDKAVYGINCKTYLDKSKPSSMPVTGDDYAGPYGEDGDRGSPGIRLTGKSGGRMFVARGEIHVPEGYKLLKLDDSSHSGCCRFDGDDLVLGNATDVWAALYEKTAELKVAVDGGLAKLGDDPWTTKAAVLGSLVQRHGFRLQTAHDLLKEAQDHQGQATVRVAYGSSAQVKKAYPDLMSQQLAGGASAPAFPEPPVGMDPFMGGAQAQYPMEMEMPIEMAPPDMGSYQSMEPQPDPSAMQSAMQAGQMGQKEVFDTAMVGSLLKSVRDDTMINRHMGDLMRGLDKLGRILFSFYWHGDTFAERYGKADMPELEDSLRNAFESLGDVILFLKQRAIEPFPEESGIGVNLEETAGD